MTNLKPTKNKLFKCLAISLIFSAPLNVVAKGNTPLPLDEIRNFVDVYNAIKKEYVEEKDGKTLIDFAIKGMLEGLDPHSAYFKKADLEDFQQGTSGSYSGFGFQLEIQNGRLIIVAPIPNSPAEKAGLQPQDRIVKIGDTLIEDMAMTDIDKLLKGKNTIDLTISRPGEKSLKVELARTTINLPSINSKQLDKAYGYIRITQFQDNTTEQFKSALDEQLSKNIKGLVIDLRNNPGGLVHVATDIADYFLDAGLIVSTKNPNTGSEEKTHAEKDNTIDNELPLVVLINKGSASASELLAGALQSHQRAVVVGQPSFGKGSVQNVIPLTNGDAIKLTTARYYTPDGVSIQAKGITPDITLSQLTVEDKEIDLLSYQEANIAGHLNADKTTNTDDKNHKQDKNKKEQKSPKKPSDKASNKNSDNLSGSALAKTDLQLFEALNVLKVLTLKKK